MNRKIGLVFSNFSGYSIHPTEATIEGIIKAVKAAGDSRIGRYVRHVLTDDGKFVSELKGIDSLSQDDIEWALTPDSEYSRYLHAM